MGCIEKRKGGQVFFTEPLNCCSTPGEQMNYDEDKIDENTLDALLFEIGRIPDRDCKDDALAILKIAE